MNYEKVDQSIKDVLDSVVDNDFDLHINVLIQVVFKDLDIEPFRLKALMVHRRLVSVIAEYPRISRDQKLKAFNKYQKEFNLHCIGCKLAYYDCFRTTYCPKRVVMVDGHK